MTIGQIKKERDELREAITAVLDASPIKINNRDDLADALRQWGQVAASHAHVIPKLEAQLKWARQALTVAERVSVYSIPPIGVEMWCVVCHAAWVVDPQKGWQIDHADNCLLAKALADFPEKPSKKCPTY